MDPLCDVFRGRGLRIWIGHLAESEARSGSQYCLRLTHKLELAHRLRDLLALARLSTAGRGEAQQLIKIDAHVGVVRTHLHLLWLGECLVLRLQFGDLFGGWRAARFGRAGSGWTRHRGLTLCDWRGAGIGLWLRGSGRRIGGHRHRAHDGHSGHGLCHRAGRGDRRSEARGHQHARDQSGPATHISSTQLHARLQVFIGSRGFQRVHPRTHRH
jgi:hypothetical protein